MRRKFKIEKDDKNAALVILESGEVDPGVYVGLHEEQYGLDEMKEAVRSGIQDFTEAVRRRNFFPTSDLCTKMHDHIKPFLFDESEDKLILDYDDAEALPIEGDEDFGDDEEGVELDELLGEGSSLGDDDIKEIDGDDDTPQFEPDDDSEHEE
ncbi:MAG: hypothetical protein ACQETC_12685 [Thermodesulfobacteriota bacterium]